MARFVYGEKLALHHDQCYSDPLAGASIVRDTVTPVSPCTKTCHDEISHRTETKNHGVLVEIVPSRRPWDYRGSSKFSSVLFIRKQLEGKSKQSRTSEAGPSDPRPGDAAPLALSRDTRGTAQGGRGSLLENGEWKERAEGAK